MYGSHSVVDIEVKSLPTKSSPELLIHEILVEALSQKPVAL